MMAEWVRHNCHDTLSEITSEDIDSLLAKGKAGLILLDYGSFQLLRSKILINDFCLA